MVFFLLLLLYIAWLERNKDEHLTADDESFKYSLFLCLSQCHSLSLSVCRSVCVCEREREGGGGGRQTDRQAGRQADRQTERDRDRQTETEKEGVVYLYAKRMLIL